MASEGPDQLPHWRYVPSFGGYFEFDVGGRKVSHFVDHGMRREIESEYYCLGNDDFLEKCAREVHQRYVEQGGSRGR